MSEFSQPLSTCSRTTDFSFCFNNSAFSDAVLVLLTLRPKSASIPWRLASSVAQLFVSAVEVSATTLTSTVPVSDSWAAAGKALGSLGQTVVSRLSPQEGTEVSISKIYQVNSALLAASSPYLRHIIQQPPQLQHLVPGLASVASRHRPRKLVAVLVQPHHVAAAEAVVKFIFTNDIALTSAQQALEALLVAEQLQVPDCAEVCQHYLEDCSMDWPVALTLVHLQHKHQQEQQHQQQKQQQQLQQGPGSLPRDSRSGGSVASVKRQGPVGRSSLHGRSSSKGSGLLRGLSWVNALEAVAPLLPVPHDSVYLQGLLLRAQDFLVHQFEDLELVMASPEGRQRLLLLPYDALRAILGHPSLKVASENTALAAAAGWLHANAAQVSSMLLSSANGSSSNSNSGSAGAMGIGAALGVKEAPGGDVCAQSVYSSALYNSSSSSNGLAKITEGSDAAVAVTTTKAGLHAAQNGAVQPASASAQVQQQAPVAASGTISLLLDLCQVLRLCQCSYTYILHVLPQLPLFKDEPGLVSGLQFEVMRFRAASKLRRKRLAAEAAAAVASAAAASTAGLSGHHLAGLDHHQQQQQQQHSPAGVSGSDSSGEADRGLASRAAPSKEGGWGDRHAAAAAAAAAAAVSAPCIGWRSGAPVDAALMQCQPRPESAMNSLDFTFTFDPQDLAEHKAGGQGGSSGGAGGGSSGGSSSGSSGVDLMARLLGLTPQQQSDTPPVISDDHYFAGYVWNLVAAADGFVGVSWRVLLPGGVDVPVAAAHLGQQQQQGQGQQPAAVVAGGASEAWGSSRQQCIGTLRLFGPDCAGFRSPEVAVTFSITGSSLSRVQRNSSSNGSLTAAPAGSSGGGAVPVPAAGVGTATVAAAAGVSKPSSKADQAGSVSPGAPSISRAVQQHQQQQQQQAQGSPNKGPKVLGRAYSEVQFVPAHCAWGFPDFSPAGWEGLKGPDGKVCLRCQLKHRE